ncbi:MAG: hypothetical protein Q9222_007930 [Ikaeria aurantiellina]
MFSCFPRPLRRIDSAEGEEGKWVFDVKVLERHPYTTQTFIPLSPPSSSSERSQSRYLVIVAPTFLPTSNTSAPPFQEKGPPDLENIQAFWANGGQAVTYGAGTWHAPMVVIGRERIDFVVVQYMNGVADDDCQEVDVEQSVGVVVAGSEEVKAVAGIRAKL